MKRNLSLLTDFYELTMANGYFSRGEIDEIECFDIFFRKCPDNGGFVIFSGLQSIIDYIKNLHFEDSDIEYLRSLGLFREGFLTYLKNFKFKGTIYSVEEGTPIFPYEPVIRLIGTKLETRLVETMFLLYCNHQSLIATKTNRIVRAANGKKVAEFGARRAQGEDASIAGARAAIVGGAFATANTLAGKLYNILVIGTMSHAWVMSFDNEYESFKAYAEEYPNNTVLLVDTYDTLRSGIPNAIKTAKEVLEPMGKRLKGVRLDSGDLAYLSKQARKMFDDAGMQDCNIFASDGLDEYTITSLENQGSQIGTYCSGERLITSASSPLLGFVDKLSAQKTKDGEFIPKIKLSENPAKITNPGLKKVVRLYDKDNHKAIADVICLVEEEPIDTTKPYKIHDQTHTWKQKEVTNFYTRDLLVPIFIDGECVYNEKTVQEIQDYCLKQVDTLWGEYKRFDNPEIYRVDLSNKLYELKMKMIREKR